MASSRPRRVLRTGEALVALYLLADWTRICERDPAPQPGWFARAGVFAGLTSTNRGVVIRRIAEGRCVYCQTPVNGSSTGDHLISLDRGGPDGLENYMPCCKSCNASKGARDLLDWWHTKNRSAADLHPDVLVAYCRLTFAHKHRLHKLNDPAEPALTSIIRELVEQLPTVQHKQSLRARVDGVVGLRVA